MDVKSESSSRFDIDMGSERSDLDVRMMDAGHDDDDQEMIDDAMDDATDDEDMEEAN